MMSEIGTRFNAPNTEYCQTCFQRTTLGLSENDPIRQLTTYIRWAEPDFQFLSAMSRVLLLPKGILL